MLRIYGANAIQQVQVRDLNGKVVYTTDASWSGTSINISSLSIGLYVAEIVADGKTFYNKFSVIR